MFFLTFFPLPFFNFYRGLKYLVFVDKQDYIEYEE